MSTFYIEKARLDKLVGERDYREKRWWFAHPSSQDEPPPAYALGHEWATKEASWIDLARAGAALGAIGQLGTQQFSSAHDALAPFCLPAARAGLLDARKPYGELSEDERIALRYFIEAVQAVATLVTQRSSWEIVGVK